MDSIQDEGAITLSNVMLRLHKYKVCAFKGVTVRNFKFHGVNLRVHLEWR